MQMLEIDPFEVVGKKYVRVRVGSNLKFDLPTSFFFFVFRVSIIVIFIVFFDSFRLAGIMLQLEIGFYILSMLLSFFD